MGLGGEATGLGEACDAGAQMAEVFWANGEIQDLFNDGREVRQGTNGLQRQSVSGTCQAPRGSENQRVLDRLDRHAAFVQLSREQAVRAADCAASARSRTVGLEKPADIFGLLHESALWIAKRWTVDGHRVAVVPHAT